MTTILARESKRAFCGCGEGACLPASEGGSFTAVLASDGYDSAWCGGCGACARYSASLHGDGGWCSAGCRAVFYISPAVIGGAS